MKRIELIEYSLTHHLHKGERYIRAKMYFKVPFFTFWTKTKVITYDITMFEDVKILTKFWDELIKDKPMIKKQALVNRIIF